MGVHCAGAAARGGSQRTSWADQIPVDLKRTIENLNGCGWSLRARAWAQSPSMCRATSMSGCATRPSGPSLFRPTLSRPVNDGLERSHSGFLKIALQRAPARHQGVERFAETRHRFGRLGGRSFIRSLNNAEERSRFPLRRVRDSAPGAPPPRPPRPPPPEGGSIAASFC